MGFCRIVRAALILPDSIIIRFARSLGAPLLDVR